MQKMPTHLQGAGTYTYECRKHDCSHCSMMELVPLPEEYFDTSPKDFNYKKSIPVSIHAKKVQKQWSGEEIGILRDNMLKSTETLLRMLPNRTKESIYTQRFNLKKMRKLFNEV
jgi:hypothetical protein